MPGVEKLAFSRSKSSKGATLASERITSKPHSRQSSSSDRMDVSTGLRISGKKRKRYRQRHSRNCRQHSSHHTADAVRYSGAWNPFLGLANGVADGSVDGFSFGHPIPGCTLLRDKEKRKKKKKKMRAELGGTYHPRSSELALIPGASSEMEKESLRTWVEMELKRQADWATSQSEPNGPALGRGNVGVGFAFLPRCDTSAVKSLELQEGRPLGLRTLVSEINGMVENSYVDERKTETDRVLEYVTRRCVVVRHPSTSMPLSSRARTTRTEVIVWGKCIPVTISSEASVVQEWIVGQSGSLFGLDVEWRPNRVRGVENKVALLQLCGENECLIIQLLFLDSKPEALRELLLNPLKSLAGVGVHSDSKRLLRDHGLLCQGEVELTILAAERLKREELKHAGLKVLVFEVLGLNMKKPKKITLSDWSKLNLDRAQVEYACIDAWVSFALARKLMAVSL